MKSSNRAADLTALLGQVPTDPTNHEAVAKFIRRLAEAECSVMFVLPGSKLPADMRSPQRRTADDRAAQQAARDAGRRDWARVKSPAGLVLATTDVDILDGYLARYVKVFESRYPDGVPVNLAVEVGGSGLVVIDCDTAAQMQRWYEAAMLDCPEVAGIDPDTAPTVRSPGQRDAVTGEWAHSDGGHFWFTVPDGVTLPAGPASLGAMSWAGDDGFAVMWDRRYVLIPPSVRAEGAYAVDSGTVYPLPDWLAESLTRAGEARAERAARSQTRVHGGDAVKRWGAQTTWVEILAPTGWVATGKTDGCGCETWTAPGVHANAKSATAHEPGCTFNDSADPHLQVWTDHDAEPFEHWRSGGEASFSISRLQAVASIHYGHDLGAAMTDLSDAYDDLALTDDLPADFGRAATDVGGDSCTPQLPEEFWSAHPTLTHVRQFAHYGVNSADAVLGAALVRLSAHLDPCVRIVTGVKRPLPLNTFVGIVGSAGTGKSSAYQASADLLDLKFGNPMDLDLIAPADQCPPELPVGSGPGVAEAFMGTVIDPGDPTMKTKVRRQVRHKVLLHSDEGAGLVAGIIDTKRGQDIGPTLRAAWTGAVLGQANASAERTREVRDYSLGLCVGFQLEALAALSTAEQLEYGTPQRFVYVSATDPTIPDDAPDDPGQLTVPLPHGPLRYDAELRVRARREALARARGDGGDVTGDDMMQAHRPALVARCAALLVVLCDPGRTEINAGDVALAEMLLDTSARLHGIAMEWRREREASERERQLQGRISEQVATAVALDGRADNIARLNERILAYVDDAGGSVEWAGRAGLRKTKFNAGDRPLADAALVRLAVEDGPLVRDGNTVRCRVS